MNYTRGNRIIGHNLRRLRRICGLSQIEVAAELDIAQSTLSKIEDGALALDAIQMIRLGELFDVHLREFSRMAEFDDDDDDNPPEAA